MRPIYSLQRVRIFHLLMTKPLDFKIQLCAFTFSNLKAIEILYQVRRENYSNGRVHLAYFQIFIKVEEEIVKIFLDKDVQFDTTVKLYNSDNDQTLSKTVLNSSNTIMK